MKIHENAGVGAPKRSNDVRGVRDKLKEQGARTRTGKAGTDRISVSEEARLLSKLRRELGDIGSVRAEKVQALRDRIEKGEYRPDLKAVARSFLESILTERDS